MPFRLPARHAGFFEIDGAALYLKAGAVLDYEAQNSYDVTVRVDDPSVGGSPDATTTFALTLTDVNDAPLAVSLENTVTSLAENTSTASRT